MDLRISRLLQWTCRHVIVSYCHKHADSTAGCAVTCTCCETISAISYSHSYGTVACVSLPPDQHSSPRHTAKHSAALLHTPLSLLHNRAEGKATIIMHDMHAADDREYDMTHTGTYLESVDSTFNEHSQLYQTTKCKCFDSKSLKRQDERQHGTRSKGAAAIGRVLDFQLLVAK